MGTPLLWIGFNAFVLIAVALDLGVFNRRLHKVELREAFWSTLAWIVISVLFGFGICPVTSARSSFSPGI